MLLHVLACDSRYGAYLVIQGNTELDEIELYFGHDIGSSTSQFATPMYGAQTGLVFERKFAAADVYVLDAPSNGTTFWIPPGEGNDKLGSYVAAVALRGGQPVGIGEYFGFQVPTDEIHEYVVTLEPYAQQIVDRWGGRPGCIAWRRMRSGREANVAVVRGDDRDCDALDASIDCNDLCSAESPLCNLDRGFCNSTDSCALGCARIGTCTPQVCLPPATCSPDCEDAIGLAAKLECSFGRHPDHRYITADLITDGSTTQLCTKSFVFSPGIPCTAPMFEYVTPALQTRFMPALVATANVPPVCLLELSGTAPFLPGEDLHMVISFAPENGVGPRPTVILGLTTSGAMQCRAMPYDVVFPTSDFLYECEP